MAESPQAPSSFTGFARQRTSTLRVRISDRVARIFITLGGLGTILAVATVMIFLLSVVIPAFFDGSASKKNDAAVAVPTDSVFASFMDDTRTLGWWVDDRGQLTLFAVRNGRQIATRPLFDGKSPSAASFSTVGDSAAFGFADGSIQVVEFVASSDVIPLSEVPDDAKSLKGDAFHVAGEAIYIRTELGDFKKQTLSVHVDPPAQLDPPSPVVLVDHIHSSNSETLCTLTEDGRLRLSNIRKKKNLITGKIRLDVDSAELPHEPRPQRTPRFLRVAGLGESVSLIWDDGLLHRFDTRDVTKPVLAEALQTAQDGASVTVATWLIGRTTLLLGDSLGRTFAWLPIKPDGTRTSDGTTLVPVHELGGPDHPVRTITSSHRSRLALVGYENGEVRVFHVTSRQMIAQAEITGSDLILNTAFAPKNDGFGVLSKTTYAHWELDPKYPEVRMASLFRPVWYENYDEPSHVWQSTGGTDDFEPKFGLWSIVFGTIKATFYSLLFGVPIALLAAIFTSEFLHPRLKPKIKPLIEMMASLPSVVLGFLAALVVAPFVENVVPSILAAFFTIPVAFVTAAYLWQLLPQKWTLRNAGLRFFFMICVLPMGILLSVVAGPIAESLFFGANIKNWLATRSGSATGGWMLLVLPLVAVTMLFLMGRHVNPWLRARTTDWTRERCARLDLAKFLGGACVALFVAWLVSWLLGAIGFDPRGSYIDTYDQRNALVVGFLMGFAIIPIIYTIAEDALSTVPDHLRAASLGAGATPWQTATRIVIPTAMSGLFSAVMIGLGRAVGETMIVLMAAGNTPVRDWNMFIGFRTLSANIAVELPEAARNSAHYRTLFLAAVTLFIMTFILNTVAEVVRQRFRKRAYQL